MAPFIEINKLMYILHVLATKVHFVLSHSITFHLYSITIISHEEFLFNDLSKPLFQSEAVSRMD